MIRYYTTYKEFVSEYKKYECAQCDECGGFRELIDTDVVCEIEHRMLHFPSLFVLRCKCCGKECFPEHSKQMINGAYQSMLPENQCIGEFVSRGYKKRFQYCKEQNYQYDHRDYYNIPGLCYDEDHSVEGFLTPVYFDRKALIYFISSPEYEVEIFSETYGRIAKKDVSGAYLYDWYIPFGFNSNGLLIMWLGDINNMDFQSKMILKAFNINSDHLIIDSEFYQAQMNCVFSEPIKETQILRNKDAFIENIKNKFGVDLSHLVEECKVHAAKVQRPIVFTEQSVSDVINAFDKILIEGFNVSQLIALYEILYAEAEREKHYKKWKSIKLIKAILTKLCAAIPNIDIEKLISPLYILHDYRIYLDHLLSGDKQEDTKNHIVSTLGVPDFEHQEEIYGEEIERLNTLFQHLVILSK